LEERLGPQGIGQPTSVRESFDATPLPNVHGRHERKRRSMDVPTMTTSVAIVLSMGAADVETVSENQLVITLRDGGEKFRITVEEEEG
jgi:hypothetical protein